MSHLQLQRLNSEITQLKSSIMNLLARSQHPAHSRVLTLLTHTTNADWLDCATQQLGPEYDVFITRMTELEAAVSQIEIGQYGYCCDCEQQIATSLLARDAAIQRCERCTK
ncbi:conjugal transfer protein TraR [Pseudoalteromonas sp.]|uniref:conjugal transfer protein TraR n=1 Tax=Pseudoalteromonas sp. TaxID=53249 RepID=UPI00356A5D1A